MPAATRAFTLTARAKLNVRLEVGDVRPDGLHEIRSVIADLLAGDEIGFSPSEGGFSVSCDDPAIPTHDNLVWRAAHALGVALPAVRIDVKKSIPIEAGLGGGSADAASALRGLAAVLAETGVTLTDDDLRTAAVRVGSDVAACLAPGMKVVEGAGEVVRQIAAPTPHWGVLLLKPAIGVSTEAAYGLLDAARAEGRDQPLRHDDGIGELRDALAAGDFGRTCALAHNDFQRVVEDEHPPVAEARLRLVSAGAAATILCGSGACVAGFFENVAEAQKALALVRPSRGEWAAATGFAHGV